jgi:hypothetical protein
MGDDPLNPFQKSVDSMPLNASNLFQPHQMQKVQNYRI